MGRNPLVLAVRRPTRGTVTMDVSLGLSLVSWNEKWYHGIVVGSNRDALGG